jgi:predicted DNA-binding transcriptional regulator
MKVQDVIDRLVALGLDDTDASVYVHLSMLGASKASDIASALKLPRTEAYRSLQTLSERGFATASLSRPIRFTASPPEKLFEELSSAQRSRVERLDKARTEVLPALLTLRSEPHRDLSKNAFRIVQGRPSIYGTLERMFRDADETLDIISTHPAAVAMGELSGTWGLAQERSKEGVVIRTILMTTPAVREKIRRTPWDPTAKFRHLSTSKMMRYIILDGRELLMWVVSDPSNRITSEGDVAVWTDAHDFVDTQAALFESIWADAVELDQVVEAGDVVRSQG